MAIRTDFVAREKLTASYLNALGGAVLSGQGLISAGKYAPLANLFSGYFSDDGNVWFEVSGTTFTFYDFQNKKTASRNITSDFSGASSILGAVSLGLYLYVLAYHSTNGLKILRYERANIGAGGTAMTASFLGSNSATKIACDGTKLFLTNAGGRTSAGDSTSRFTISEPVSGTWRYTWNGTGTDPNFLTSGLTVGKTITIAGATNASNNGSFVISALTDDYVEVANATTTAYSDVFSSNPFSNGWTQTGQYVWDSGNTEIDAPNVSYGHFYRSFIPATSGIYRFSVTIANFLTGAPWVMASTSSPYVADTHIIDVTSNGLKTGTKTLTAGTTYYPYFGARDVVHSCSVQDFKIEKLGGIAETNSACTFTFTFQDFEILKSTISGTTLTAESVITCGSTAGYFDSLAVDATAIYSYDSSSPYYQRKFNKTTGTLENTSGIGVAGYGFFGTNAGTFFGMPGYSSQKVFAPVFV